MISQNDRHLFRSKTDRRKIHRETEEAEGKRNNKKTSYAWTVCCTKHNSLRSENTVGHSPPVNKGQTAHILSGTSKIYSQQNVE